MKPEIRRAALRAAAKAALVMTIGCSGGKGSPPPSSTTPDPVPVAAGASCADHLGGLATAKPEALAADDPLRSRGEVYGAFADVAARQSARTQECCAEALERDGSSAAQRWECCSALPATAQAMACTPWGPPCPPQMA